MPKGVYEHKLQTEECKRKRSEAMKKSWQTKDWSERNKKVGQKTKERALRLGFQPPSRKGISQNKGEKNGNWRDGKSFEIYPEEWTDTLKEQIRKRDNFTCQVCGKIQDKLKGFYKKLDVHHIDYDKRNCNPDNLITLCHICHAKNQFSNKKND